MGTSFVSSEDLRSATLDLLQVRVPTSHSQQGGVQLRPRSHGGGQLNKRPQQQEESVQVVLDVSFSTLLRTCSLSCREGGRVDSLPGLLKRFQAREGGGWRRQVKEKRGDVVVICFEFLHITGIQAIQLDRQKKTQSGI